MTQELLRSRPDRPEPAGYSKESSRLPWHRKASFLGSLAILLALYIAYLLRPPFAPPYIARFAPLSASGKAKFGPLVTDGRDIYYLELIGGHQSLARVPVSGGDSTLLTTTLDNLQLADISPDGRELLVGTRVGTQSEWPLWKISLDAGLPATRLGSVLGHAGTYSPNGEQIAYGMGYDLYLANSDGSEPRVLTSTSRGGPVDSLVARRIGPSIHDPQSAEPDKCALGGCEFRKEPAAAVAGLEQSVVGVLRQLDAGRKVFRVSIYAQLVISNLCDQGKIGSSQETGSIACAAHQRAGGLPQPSANPRWAANSGGGRPAAQ